MRITIEQDPGQAGMVSAVRVAEVISFHCGVEATIVARSMPSREEIRKSLASCVRRCAGKPVWDKCIRCGEGPCTIGAPSDYAALA